MAGANRDKNQLECNKRARKEYERKNYKRQTVLFKITELEDIEAYCKEHNIPKNTFFRQACMKHIGKPFV